jgi:hypothetical protein
VLGALEILPAMYDFLPVSKPRLLVESRENGDCGREVWPGPTSEIIKHPREGVVVDAKLEKRLVIFISGGMKLNSWR